MEKYNTFEDFTNAFKTGFAKRYGFTEGSVPKKVEEYVMNYNVFKKMLNSIKFYISSYTNKSKSLSYDSKSAIRGEKNVGWDMKIIFRISFESGLIEPSIEHSSKQTGQIVNKNEIEVVDKGLRDLFK